MAREVYELKTCPEDKAVALSVVRLNMESILEELLRQIPIKHVASFLAKCYKTEPESIPDAPEKRMDQILLVEGDFAGLLIRNRWAGDDESTIKPLMNSLARASTEFYDTLEGQVRLEKIRLMTLRLLERDD
ncbi:MAG TPA: hypothetical protein DEA96_11975 [Leptospiraceae bacterium]|nr:hypothetical protein [Spirochaetaceae bacterium]HBS05677.1 hypothetical protein [Leptospiraceae bacterium]|tara:strand:+ start:21075 stop:21470 length:396 start_codon:yes stop_codon:yes gene_type:complete